MPPCSCLLPPRSGANSLVNDPLLEFVRKAMLTKLPSGLSRSPSNLAATSPFATIVPGQQPEQQQQQQGGNQQAAAPPATVASVQPAAQPPTMPAGQLASQRTISGDGLGDRPSGSSVTQPSRGSSLSLSIDIRSVGRLQPAGGGRGMRACCSACVDTACIVCCSEGHWLIRG